MTIAILTMPKIPVEMTTENNSVYDAKPTSNGSKLSAGLFFENMPLDPDKDSSRICARSP